MSDQPPPNFPQPEAETAQPHDLALRMLYDEQARLRAELDKVRQQQDEKKEGAQKDDAGGAEDNSQTDEQKEKKPAKEPAKERSRHWVRAHPVATLGIVFGFLILVVVGILLWIYLSSYVTTDDAFVDGHTDPIAPRISGYVKAVYVENTYRVKKGQLLVEIDPRDNQVAKEQAAAQYSQAQASVAAQQPNVPITATTQSVQVSSAEYNVASTEASVAAAKERYQSSLADLHQAEANELNAAREEERYRLLVEKEEVSREQYDQQATNERAQAAAVASRRETADAASRQVTTAEAQLGTAREELRQMRENTPRQIAMQRATLAQRQADAEARRAASAQSELNLEYTRIFAPEDGIVGDKQVQLASQVAAGQEMFALTQTNDLWITANFKETDIVQMHPGQSVTLHVDALAEDFEGYVEALPGGTGAIYSLLPPENATGNYVKVVQRLPVRIRLRPGQRDMSRLAPGMSVEPKVWIK